MKKIITLSLVLCLLITSVSNFSFAQNTNTPPASDPTDSLYCSNQSSVCGTAPEQFTQLMDFVREMTNTIKTIWTEWDYLGQYVSPNWFKWDLFSPPKKTLVGRVVRNISQKLKFAAASTAILTSPVNIAGLKDMVWWISLLAKNRVFTRDNLLIGQLESQLNDKKLELWLWGWWYETVIPENRAIMQSIIQKYVDKWLFLPWSTVKAGVTYNNVASLLTQVLSSAKTFLFFGSISQFDEITRWSSDQYIFVGFVADALQKVERVYNCARWPNYICSSESKKFKEYFSKMWKSISFKSTERKKTWKDAIDRLKQVFAKEQTQAFKDREADLLRSMYGTTQVSKSKWIKGLLIDPFKKTREDIKQSWQGIGQQAQDLANDVTTFRTFPPYIKGNVPLSPTLPSDTVLTTDLTKSIDTYLYDVFLNAKSDLDLVSMSEPRGVTPAFRILGKQISVIENDILGSKEKDDSLINYLWAACELQCGRAQDCR